MNSWTAILTHALQHSRVAAGFADAFLKSFVILFVVGIVCFCWRRSSASARHLVWFLAMAGLLFLPGFSSFLPGWPRPLWEVGTHADSGNELTFTLELVPAKAPAVSLHQAQPFPREAHLKVPEVSGWQLISKPAG